VTETRLGGPGGKVCIAELVPSGYKIDHVPRQGRGGGVAVIYKAPLKLTMLASSRNSNVTSFEYMDCNITVKNFSLRFAVVYRPSPNKQNGLKTSTILDDEWPTFLANFTTAENDIIVVGDVNFHLDKP